MPLLQIVNEVSGEKSPYPFFAQYQDSDLSCRAWVCTTDKRITLREFVGITGGALVSMNRCLYPILVARSFIGKPDSEVIGMVKALDKELGLGESIIEDIGPAWPIVSRGSQQFAVLPSHAHLFTHLKDFSLDALKYF